jgi:hypothetical protein
MEEDKISTRRLDLIPPIDKLKKIIFGLSALDSIISGGAILSYYPKWNNNDILASFYDGCGNYFKIYFNKDGAIIIGFDHESEMTPYKNDPPELFDRKLIESVPSEFEPAFHTNLECEEFSEELTYCIWRKYSDEAWKTGNIDFDNLVEKFGNDPDGSEFQLFLIEGTPESFLEWAKIQIDCDFDLDKEIIKHFIENKPVTEEILINNFPDRNLLA